MENSNFLLQTDARQFHPDALRKARERGRPALFPGTDGSSRAAWHPVPAAGSRPRGAAMDDVEWPAGGDPHLSRRASLRRPAPHHCASAGAALAGLHRAGASFALARNNSLCVAGWRPLADATRAGRMMSNRVLARTRFRELASPRTHLADAICHPASSMPICFPTMCCS